jgi:hypothetical protein
MAILIQLIRHFNTGASNGGGDLFVATFEDTF